MGLRILLPDGKNRKEYAMNQTVVSPLPYLHTLPASLPIEGAVRIELVEGVPLFKASNQVQERIEVLLEKNRAGALTADEVQELDLYEEIDDYLSFINRTVRNLTQSLSEGSP
jgi:uncharacterized protein YnzC (UPF0291/DUF896 family)